MRSAGPEAGRWAARAGHPAEHRPPRFAFLRQIRLRLAALAALLLLAWTLPAAAQGIEIAETAEQFAISSGAYRWTISKTAFTVIEAASAAGAVRLAGGQASADFLGSTSTFGPPAEFLLGADWVELRGWADRAKNLWYVARYRFFPDQPYAHLALSLVDRHEGFPTEAQWDGYWEDRLLSNFRVSLRTTADLAGKYFRQMSSFDGRQAGVDPDLVIQAGEGSPYRWRRSLDVAELEIRHGLSEAPDRAAGLTNSVTWIPNHVGRARLVATLTPFSGGEDYLGADDVVYEVQHAGGVAHLTLDQDRKELDLGSYELNRDSAVILYTESTAGFEGVVRARSLRVEPEDGAPFEIRFRRLADDVLQDSGYALGVVDLWQHWPIEVYSSGRELTVNAIAQPARWSGGIGLTLDLAIVLEAGRAKDALAAIKAPPARPGLPAWWSPFDGTLTPNPAYDRLIARAYDTIHAADEEDDNYGWRVYGDYQIGPSYVLDDGPYEDWGGLQYDLASGLLLGWLRSGDERLWHRARAAVRHQMDVALVKYYPYAPKRSGQMYRKGECPRDDAITCQESIPDFGYGYRALLLWHFLTGEAWARELAWQQIDALAYFSARSGGTARSSSGWLVETGTRPGAWILRGLLTGAAVFPEGTRGFAEAGEGIDFPRGTSYATLLEEQIAAFLPQINERIGHYPSDQPVWSGQGLEALAMAYLEPSGRYRSPALRQAIEGTCADLENSMRWSGGAYEYVYDRTPEDEILEWIEEPNYGWLWLSGFAACAEILPSERYAALADGLFEHLIDFAGSQETIAVREWSSILAYGGYYLERRAAALN
jgi:hypothetical protein